MPLGLNPHQYRMGRKNFAPFSGQQKNVNLFEKPFDKFFIVKRISENNETFNSVSPFLVEKAMTGALGEVVSTRKLRSGDLLVEVGSRKQAQQIIKLKVLASLTGSESAHTALNSSKGVITCGELFNDTLDKITAELKPEKVTHVCRITIRRDGQLLLTKHFILTFSRPKLTERVKVGYMRLAVRPYIPNPLWCFQCQRFGHSKSNCRGTLTCARYAVKGHESQQCSAEEKCVNCNGNHTSFSRSCPRWLMEKQILTIKHKENISYSEARRKVQCVQTPTPGVTCASVLQKQFCANCSCTNCVKNINESKPPVKSDSDSEKSVTSAPETGKPEIAQRKRKSNESLKLKLSKRGVSEKHLSQKIKASSLHNSVTLGLANQGIVQKDLSSIFSGVPNCLELIALHSSEEEDEIQMSCAISIFWCNARVLIHLDETILVKITLN
ncbi:uncharacterized protein LOC129956532 [Argiope bruennichi]|uniref:uncharacterized protein LOC129956532 n=1 Tax=Argiope bruennichi TaxID=94029 RepID=UPI002494EF78|nr:uncharacterized protein LOC129956532 [Argiope bruennichi]